MSRGHDSAVDVSVNAEYERNRKIDTHYTTKRTTYKVELDSPESMNFLGSFFCAHSGHTISYNVDLDCGITLDVNLAHIREKMSPLKTRGNGKRNVRSLKPNVNINAS